MGRGLQPKKKGSAALLIIDMINDFKHEDGDELFENTRPVARTIAQLKPRARAAGMPVIYVNDNFQEWRASFATTVEHVEKSGTAGREMVSLLRPSEDDYYVLKPHRSGFYKTPLGLLLDHLQTSELFITGITRDMCVLLTAQEADIRGYKIGVPADCVTAVKIDYHEQALDLIARTTNADTTASTDLDLVKKNTSSDDEVSRAAS